MIKQRKILIEKYYSQEEAMDDLFRELTAGCYIVKLDDYPNLILYKKNNNFIMKQDLKNKSFFFDYNKIWLAFELKFDLSYQKKQNFLYYILELHLNLNGYKPSLAILQTPIQNTLVLKLNDIK